MRYEGHVQLQAVLGLRRTRPCGVKILAYGTLVYEYSTSPYQQFMTNLVGAQLQGLEQACCLQLRIHALVYVYTPCASISMCCQIRTKQVLRMLARQQ